MPGLVLGAGNPMMTQAGSQQGCWLAFGMFSLGREDAWRWVWAGPGGQLPRLVAIREDSLKGYSSAVAAPAPPGRTHHAVTLVMSLWACHIIYRQPEMPPATHISFPQFIFQSGGFTKLYTIKSKISTACRMGKTCFAPARIRISV